MVVGNDGTVDPLVHKSPQFVYPCLSVGGDLPAKIGCHKSPMIMLDMQMCNIEERQQLNCTRQKLSVNESCLAECGELCVWSWYAGRWCWVLQLVSDVTKPSMAAAQEAASGCQSHAALESFAELEVVGAQGETPRETLPDLADSSNYRWFPRDFYPFPGELARGYVQQTVVNGHGPVQQSTPSAATVQIGIPQNHQLGKKKQDTRNGHQDFIGNMDEHG